jgi:uncharacterized protein (DUF58 family)
VGIVAVCVAMAVQFGGRALDAVVMPLILVVVAAGIAIRRADRPNVYRTVPGDDFVGRTGTVELEFETGKPQAGVVHDELPAGLASEENRIETTVGRGPVTYEVTYLERGLHEVGPLTLSVTDVLGIATKTFEYGPTDTVVVYPRVYELTGASRSELAMLAGSALDREREEFDRLREYESGDSLRDVHWKSSAKRPAEDLVVKEFVAEEEVGDVSIAVEATDGNADRMAEAAASLAIHFLSMGVAVGMAVPDGVSLDPDAGADHRTRLLETLARVGAGEVGGTDRDDADVYVDATDGEVTVTIGGRETTFESLAGVRIRDADGADAAADADPDGVPAAAAAGVVR